MRINYCVKLLASLVHGFKTLIGLLLIGICFYIIFSDWGHLEPSFFIGTGVMLGLMGLVLVISSCIGSQGIQTQMRSFGFWSGQRIIMVYIFIEIVILAYVVYLYIYIAAAMEQFKSDSAEIDLLGDSSSTSVPFSSVERLLENKFNSFYFGMASSCQEVFLWFWRVVNTVCPPQLDQARCQACYSFSVTMCSADQDSCYSTASTVDNYRCPYMQCRAELLEYVTRNSVSSGFIGVVGVYGALQVVSIVLAARLATFDFTNRGVIRIVPIDDGGNPVVEIGPPLSVNQPISSSAAASGKPWPAPKFSPRPQEEELL